MRLSAMFLIIALAACKDEVSKSEIEGADHLEWCDSIYHRNVSCPRHGQVVVPPEVLAQEEARHLEWCDFIDHRNVGCPRYSN